jgi:prolyl-tRNA editing enzyme YbaK/EbsC (Cys-tRNA(Pro) deacylase)
MPDFAGFLVLQQR